MGSWPASGVWTGRIQPPGAALRSLPHKDERAPEQGVLARLAPGTQVTVLRLHRGWLQVGVVLGGTTRSGYVSPDLVQPVPLRASAGATRPAPTQESAAEVPVNVAGPDNSMRVALALKLSWRSWPGEVAHAAREAFSDPTFIVTLVLVMAVYVGLWLVPEPTLLTKVLAGALTAALLAQFAWEDIYGLVEAWFELQERCELATREEHLQAAGERFAKKVGQVGFDVLLFILLWRVGKQVQPKVSEIGARRAQARADAEVAAAEARPGSNVRRAATGEALQVLDKARARAKDNSPTSILDALHESLPPEAQRGLTALRRRGDTHALKTLEGVLRGGEDLNSMLFNHGVPKAESASARASLLKAEGRQAYTMLLQLNTLRDPLLRHAMRAELVANFIKTLETLKTPLDWQQLKRAITQRNLTDLIGVLGEAMQRTQLSELYPASKDYRIFANVEILRLVEGFTRISQWQAVERAAGRTGEPKGLYEHEGKLWKSETEVDALVAKRGLRGRWRPVELEQAKTGNKDTLTGAREQNAKALAALQELAAGSQKVRLYERPSKNTLGRDLTQTFDLSALHEVRTSARGVPNKEFDRSLPFSREVLQEVALSLIEQGLPSTPASPRPVAHNSQQGGKEGE